MSLLAITVIGHDRPGIIADTTRLLADLGANLEDSTMTILRGHFAMVLLASASASTDDAQAALEPLTTDGALSIVVKEVPPEPETAPMGPTYLLSVHGADRPGIVSAVTSVVASAGGNITDLSTRLVGDLYVVVAELDLPSTVDSLAGALKQAAQTLGVEATLRPAEADVL